MIIENKRTGKQETVTIEQWNKMSELQLQKFWVVIDKGEVTVQTSIEIENFLNPEKKNAGDVVSKKPKK